MFGKCASAWGADDPWWGESELWVHYDGFGSGGVWGSGGEPAAPDPWTADEFGRLTAGEKALVRRDRLKWWSRVFEMRNLRDSAYVQSMRAAGVEVMTDDSHQNAYQHAIWAASMKRAYGHADALAWTNAHEDLGRTLTASELRTRSMDLYNNAVGLSRAGSSGPNGSAEADVLPGAGQLCWLVGTGASATCGGTP